MIKKYLPYILILIILVGLFSPIVDVHAAGNDFKTEIDDGCADILNSSFSGCLLKLVYYTIFQLPSFLLWLSAQFFNAMVAIGISSSMTASSEFIPSAWAVVRDLSNVFFILILLYIALQTILGIGHETKKAIAQVIVMALLINFSMFFTKVVIDTSNILAMVFYNKLNVSTPGGQTYTPSTPGSYAEKDISGAIYRNFDATKLVGPDLLNRLKTIDVFGNPVTEQQLPLSLTLGMMVLAGAIMGYAAYAFFISGISFLGRLIELWVLIIFSPFAFMSSTLPQLSKRSYIGWDDWLHKLLATSFMAPIFMFFLYLIFLILQSNIFKNTTAGFTAGPGIIANILSILMPALIILALLRKMTHYAQEGGGEFGKMIVGGAKIAGGLALGAATGGAALLGTGAIGGLATKAAGSEFLKEGAKNKGIGGYAARMALKGANYGSKASFDLRNAPGVGSLSGKLGLDLQSAKVMGLGTKEGGFKGEAERVAKELKEESEMQKTSMSDSEVKEWSKKRQEKWVKNGSKPDDKPKEYSTAKELNHDRLHAYQENLGQSGLLGTAAYEAVRLGGSKWGGIINNKNFSESEEYKKKFKEKHGENSTVEYDGEIAKKVNDARVKMAKLAIGATAAILSGGKLGAAVTGLGGGSMGMAGLAGTVASNLGTAGAIAGGAGAYGYYSTETKGEGKFDAELKKHEKDEKKISDRIDSIQNLLEKGKSYGVVEEEDGKNKVNLDKLEQAIASEEFENKKIEIELKKLVEAGGADSAGIARLKAAAITNMTKTSELKKMRNAEKELYDLGKDMSAFNAHGKDDHKDEKHGGGHAASAHETHAPTPGDAAATHAAPVADSHGDSHGGGDHGGDHGGGGHH